MGIKEILAYLDVEIARLQQAKAVLSGAANYIPVKRESAKPKATSPSKKKRNLSPEGRARIAAAVKARWAKQKKASR
jgi:hypothetical protein